MNEVRYARPASLSGALAIMEQFGSSARVLNGGTDLMVRVQRMQAEPAMIVDIKRVGEIADTIDTTGDGAIIGARVVMTAITANEIMCRRYPALVAAASTVGSVQIRNRATIAGNICNASPAADTIPPLLVYGATVTLVSSAGRREVPLEEFFLGPGRTVCGPTELVTAITLAPSGEQYGTAFGRLTRRHGVDLASVNVACGVARDGTVTFAFGAAAPTAVVARDRSGKLGDPDLPAEERDELLEALVERTSPITDVRAGARYRRAMLVTLSRRVLNEAIERRRASGGE